MDGQARQAREPVLALKEAKRRLDETEGAGEHHVAEGGGFVVAQAAGEVAVWPGDGDEGEGAGGAVGGVEGCAMPAAGDDVLVGQLAMLQPLDEPVEQVGRDAAGVVLEEAIDGATAHGDGEGVHVADVDEHGAVLGGSSGHERVAEAAKHGGRAGVHDHGAGDELGDGVHAQHAGRRRAKRHLVGIAAGSEQALEEGVAGVVGVAARRIAVILDGDRDDGWDGDLEGGQRMAQGWQVDVAEPDRIGVGRWRLDELDAHGAHALQVVVERAGGRGGGVDRQAGGAVRQDRLAACSTAHHGAVEEERAPAGRDSADAGSDNLRLRRQDELGAVLGRLLGVVEPDVLSARARIKREDAHRRHG